jgi:C_GCAxxG_C_C family probable redox protein
MSLAGETLAVQSNELFNGGLYCSEAILQVFNSELNLGLTENALKMATGFGAGLGASKDCCGALTGAVLVLGAVKGRISKDESVADVFAATQELHSRFVEKFGSTSCSALTEPIEFGGPDHLPYCNKFVAESVVIIADILNREA